MNHIAISDSDIEVPAELIAEGLGIPVAEIQSLMREGTITSRCESGVGEDAGRHRLTFFYKGCRLRLIIDGEGRVIQRATIDYGNRLPPEVLRRP